MTAKNKGLGVGWHAINPKTNDYYKRPFAYTTKADSDQVEIAAGLNYTWNDLNSLPYLSTELQEVVDRFIQDGHGNKYLRDFVMPAYEEVQ